MYFTYKVNIPKGKKITHNIIKGTEYISYEYDRVYVVEKKYNIPKRTTIGKVCEGEDGKMYPNPNFIKYFPDVELPEEVEEKEYSSCIKVGNYLVIEKLLKESGLDNILKEILGDKVTLSDEDYYIDLLFYHTILHCYVAVELKNTKFKPEYIGKMNFYLTALDETVKTESDKNSIGLILCRDKDKLTVEYALKDVNKPIGVSSYEIQKYLPKDITIKLPTEEDINLHVDVK